MYVSEKHKFTFGQSVTLTLGPNCVAIFSDTKDADTSLERYFFLLSDAIGANSECHRVFGLGAI